jgi:hypothetical protein
MADEIRGAKLTAPKMMRPSICVSPRPEDFQETFSDLVSKDLEGIFPSKRTSKKEAVSPFVADSLVDAVKPKEKPRVSESVGDSLGVSIGGIPDSKEKPLAKLPRASTPYSKALSEAGKQYSHISGLAKSGKAVSNWNKVAAYYNVGNAFLNGSPDDCLSSAWTLGKSFMKTPAAIPVWLAEELVVPHMTDDETIVNPYIIPNLGDISVSPGAPEWVHEKVADINRTRYFHDPVAYNRLQAPPLAKAYNSHNPREGRLMD